MNYLSSFSIKWFNIPQRTNSYSPMPTEIGNNKCEKQTEIQMKTMAESSAFLCFLPHSGARL